MSNKIVEGMNPGDCCCDYSNPFTVVRNLSNFSSVCSGIALSIILTALISVALWQGLGLLQNVQYTKCLMILKWTAVAFGSSVGLSTIMHLFHKFCCK